MHAHTRALVDGLHWAEDGGFWIIREIIAQAGEKDKINGWSLSEFGCVLVYVGLGLGGGEGQINVSTVYVREGDTALDIGNVK